MNKACRKMLKDIEQYERYENQNKKSTIGSVQKIISSYANKGKSGY